MRRPRKQDIDEQAENSNKKARQNDPMSDPLMKRFEKDLFQVLRQFEIDEDTKISEVTVSHIMLGLGFLSESDFDEEAVQSIWHNLQPVGGAAPERRTDGEE